MADEKKFADEKLTDEQLEHVAGGDYSQLTNDSVFLYGLGLLDRSYTQSELMESQEAMKKVYDAFQKLGIGLGFCKGVSNDYYFGQQCLDQDEAWKVAKSQAERLKIGS